MIRSRWQGFNVESGENQAPMLVTHWYVLKQGLIFALFSFPLLSGFGLWLARRVLKPADQPLSQTEIVSEPLPLESEP